MLFIFLNLVFSIVLSNVGLIREILKEEKSVNKLDGLEFFVFWKVKLELILIFFMVLVKVLVVL